MAECAFYTLFSGSSGNSVYVTCGEDAILIDAGKNCKTVENALVGLGSSLSKSVSPAFFFKVISCPLP